MFSILLRHLLARCRLVELPSGGDLLLPELRDRLALQPLDLPLQPLDLLLESPDSHELGLLARRRRLPPRPLNRLLLHRPQLCRPAAGRRRLRGPGRARLPDLKGTRNSR